MKNRKKGISTDKGLSQKLNVSTRTVFNLRHMDGLKKNADGTFDITKAKRLLKARQERGRAGTVKTKTGERSKWDIEWRKNKALREKLKYRQEMGELVEKAAVTKEVITRELAFKKAFMGLPRDMSTRLVGCGIREIEATLTKFVTSAFRKLARRGNSTQAG